MSGRLPTHLVVSALLRRVNDAGGLGTVLARGDADAGAVLIITSERGAGPRCLERAPGLDGQARLAATGPDDGDLQSIAEYWQRRRVRDPDLWVIELDIAQAERFAAETMLLY
ncbi:DUF1491 family protein [Sphingomonas sp.]|uniref:DUF1491 family protein n=1 Tax=Sphingomonas sp. TaxID=28214 RepID=UPI001E0D822D|nr:DUF1491 family protein [Sphingomonas sp.]MBX9795524.1 DUF1491 family protein [Sphingomonas sp.]